MRAAVFGGSVFVEHLGDAHGGTVVPDGVAGGADGAVCVHAERLQRSAGGERSHCAGGDGRRDQCTGVAGQPRDD